MTLDKCFLLIKPLPPHLTQDVVLEIARFNSEASLFAAYFVNFLISTVLKETAEKQKQDNLSDHDAMMYAQYVYSFLKCK